MQINSYTLKNDQYQRSNRPIQNTKSNFILGKETPPTPYVYNRTLYTKHTTYATHIRYNASN